MSGKRRKCKNIQGTSKNEDTDEQMQVNDCETEREEPREDEPGCSQAVAVLEKRNTVDITGLAMTSLHCQVSNREAAAIASAYVGDLSRSGHLPQMPPSWPWTPPKFRGWGPGGRVVWGVGLSSRDVQVAGSIPVATRSRDPPYHRGFGDCDTYLQCGCGRTRMCNKRGNGRKLAK